jgi:hypothetical protein
MGKKCIPGVFCIENMTLFLLFVIIILCIYFYYILIVKNVNREKDNDAKISIVYPLNQHVGETIGGVSSRVVLDPYGPPLRNDGVYFPRDSADVRGSIPITEVRGSIPVRGAVPINMETRGTGMDYTQIGILTKSTGGDSPLILPLMGRQPMTGRDKWQYYTVSNTGFLNTKLPVSLNGKSCTGEYGCDILNNGDTVFVEGYDSTFRVTVYENSQFRYIPYL